MFRRLLRVRVGLPPSARWLGCLVLLATLGGTQTADAPQPIFRLDLKSLGAVGLELPLPLPAPGQLAPVYPPSFGFLDNSTLVISFAVWNSRTTLSKRSDEKGGTRLLHTAVVDLPSGKVVAKKTWGTMHEQDVVLPLSEGRLLVYSGNKLAIVSRDWREEQAHDLGKPAPGEPQRRLFASPTLHTLFVVSSAGLHREHVEVFDAGTLTRVHEFAVESVGLDAGSDSYLAYMLPAKTGYALFVLPLKNLGKASPPSLDPVLFTKDDGCRQPDFVGDDTLVFSWVCDAVTLIGIDGKVRERVGLGGSRLLLSRRNLSPQPGDRFVVRVADSASPLKTEGAPDPIRVYQTGPLHAVWELEDPPATPGRLPVSDARLSADGSLLAVLHGFDLSVYRMPSMVTLGAERSVPSPVEPVKVARGPGVEVSMASLADLRHDAIEVWVSVSNRGTTDITLHPQRATLQIPSPKRKTLPALDPDKLARNIRYVGKVDADHEWDVCYVLNNYACPKSDRIRQAGEANAADVRRSALQPQILKPGQQVQGTIYFAYQRKRGEAVLRVPVGDQVFEFSVPAPKK